MSKENNIEQIIQNTDKLEVISKLFKVNTENNNFVLKEAIQLSNSGLLPIIVSNHQSHADGIPTSMIIDHLQSSCSNIQGTYLLVAKSAILGHQGQIIQESLLLFEQMMSSKKIELLPIVRPKDVTDYGLLQSENRQMLKEIMRAESNKKGLIIFPEGTIQGGRINQDTNKINGIVDCSANAILDFAIDSYSNKKYFILPVAINGSYRISEYFDGKISMSDLFDSKIDIVVGQPITSQMFEKDIDKTSYIMTKIAQLLPLESQGFYTKKNRVNLD